MGPDNGTGVAGRSMSGGGKLIYVQGFETLFGKLVGNCRSGYASANDDGVIIF